MHSTPVIDLHDGRTDLREGARRRPSCGLLALLGGACMTLVSACSVDVARNLPETEANRVIVALNRGGIAASKAPERDNEGHFSVRIPEADLSSAVLALQNEGLPAERSPGVLDSLGKSGLVASRTSEHARLIVGIAGDLEQSLSDVAGVLTARVHLAVPEIDPLSPADARRAASASVLLRHQGASPPLLAGDVQRLVAGAVSGLAPDEVAVVFLSVPSPTDGREPALAQFGPLSVSRSSMTSLRWMVGTVATVNVLLLAALLFLWLRLRKSAPLMSSARGGG